MFLTETPTSEEPGLKNNLDRRAIGFTDLASNFLKEELSINRLRIFYEPSIKKLTRQSRIKPSHIKLLGIQEGENHSPFKYGKEFIKHMCEFISTYESGYTGHFALLETTQIDNETQWWYTKASICAVNIHNCPEEFIVISLRLDPTENFERATQLFNQRQNFRDSKNSRFKLLTPREKEILLLLSKGFNNPAIADRLFISRRTVEQHRKNLNRKIGTNSIPEIIQYAQAFDLQSA